MNDKRCATCEYAEYDEIQGYICTNSESEYIADFVEANHTCVDYVSREND